MDRAVRWVVLQIRVPFRVLFARVPSYIWDLEHYPGVDRFGVDTGCCIDLVVDMSL